MPKITKILHLENKDTYAVVHAQTDEGDDVSIWVGGEVQVYLHKGKIKAFVKRNKT